MSNTPDHRQISNPSGNQGDRQAPADRQMSNLDHLSRQALTLAAARVLWSSRDGAISNTSLFPSSPYSPIQITDDIIDELIHQIEKRRIPRYRDITEEILLTLAGKILHDQEIYLPFTWKFSDRLIKRAIKDSRKHGFGKIIYDTLCERLKEEFGYRVSLIMVIEGDASKKWHAHGILGIRPTLPNLLKARNSLRRANVDRTPKEIKFSKPSNGIYWCSDYIAKSLDETSKHIEKVTGAKLESPVHIDAITRSEVKRFYETLHPPKYKPIVIDHRIIESARRAKEKLRSIVAQEDYEQAMKRWEREPRLRHKFPKPTR